MLRDFPRGKWPVLDMLKKLDSLVSCFVVIIIVGKVDSVAATPRKVGKTICAHCLFVCLFVYLLLFFVCLSIDLHINTQHTQRQTRGVPPRCKS